MVGGRAVGTVGGWRALRELGAGLAVGAGRRAGRGSGGAGRWGRGSAVGDPALGGGQRAWWKGGGRGRWEGPSRNDMGGGAWPGGAPCAPVERGAGLLSFQLTEAREPGSRASRRDLGASWGCHGWSEGIADMAHLRGFANQVRVGVWVVSGLPELLET